MNGIDSLVAEGGGLLHKRQLVALGARDRQLTWAVRHGYVRRPRRGWYSTFAPSDPRYIAVQAGGRLTGASALAQLDAWQWNSRPPITVSVPRNASRFRRMRGVKVVWDPLEMSERGSNWAVAPTDALREALLECSFEDSVALLDWAVDCGLVDADDIPRIAAGLPRDVAGIAAWTDKQGDSFLESIARTRLVRHGYSVVSQGRLPNGQKIDLVVDDVLGIELDGFAYHADTFEEDREKDLEIQITGRSVLRLSYRMVLRYWDRIVKAIDVALANHRRGPAGPAAKGLPWPRLPRHGTRLWRLKAPRAQSRHGPQSEGQRSVRRGRHRRLGTIFG